LYLIIFNNTCIWVTIRNKKMSNYYCLNNLIKTGGIMRFSDLKTGTKILTGFMLVVLIAVIIGVVGLIGLRNVGKSFHDVSDVRLPGAQYLGEMEVNIDRVQAGYVRLLDNQLSRAQREAILSEIAGYRANYVRNNELFAAFPLSDEENRIYRQAMQVLDGWRNINVQQVDRLHNELMATDLLNPMQTNRDLEQFMKDHYALQVQTINSIQSGRTFDGGDDATRCNFGQWLPNFRTSNQEINRNMRDMMAHHDSFHTSVHRIKQLIQQGNRDAAMRQYLDVMAPAAENVFNYFAIINREAIGAVEVYEELSQVIGNDARNAQVEFTGLLNQLKQINRAAAEADTNAGDATIVQSNSMVLTGIVIGIIIALILGYTITRMVTTGVNKGVGIAQTIADGDLTINVDSNLLEQKDEIGQLANAMQRMVEKLREVIGSVVSGSDNIASASQQMSSSAQQMSQGSTEQASSAEEVSSSMEEMAANIQQNTDNARETEKMARQAETGIVDSSKASEQAVTAMRDIAEKISIIGEISRQTNILALNAAVEAARAGEHGKGFAVVAAEVRKLAERSQVAAAEIDKLSKFGVSISEEAGKKLAIIVPEIQKTASLVQEIAAASIEQNSGADQVNSAIQQLNQVTQQNAATSEEMATSSEELASQAEQLREIVAYFKIDSRRGYQNTAAAPAKKAQSNTFAQTVAPKPAVAKKPIAPKPASAKYQATTKPGATKSSNTGSGVKLDLGNVKDDEYERF
jgi:methyl-accepting chemotaxis protein